MMVCSGCDSVDKLKAKLPNLEKEILDPNKFKEAESTVLTQKKANWDTLALKDMNYDEVQNLYFRDCRCGDQYNLLKEEISDCDNELCVECDTCSNTIIIVTNG